jgi:hypothetical protein
MEDAATAEISRAQIWRWVRHRVALSSGATVTAGFVAQLVDEEMRRIEREIGPARVRTGRFPEAKRIFLRVATEEPLVEFLTPRDRITHNTPYLLRPGAARRVSHPAGVRGALAPGGVRRMRVGSTAGAG